MFSNTFFFLFLDSVDKHHRSFIIIPQVTYALFISSHSIFFPVQLGNFYCSIFLLTDFDLCPPPICCWDNPLNFILIAIFSVLKLHFVLCLLFIAETFYFSFVASNFAITYWTIVYDDYRLFFLHWSWDFPFSRFDEWFLNGNLEVYGMILSGCGPYLNFLFQLTSPWHCFGWGCGGVCSYVTASWDESPATPSASVDTWDYYFVCVHVLHSHFYCFDILLIPVKISKSISGNLWVHS